MDLSSILPLLMGGGLNGGNQAQTMSTLLSAMSGNKGTQNPMPTRSQSSSGLDPALIMSLLNKNGDKQNNNLDIVNLMSVMNQKNNRPHHKGLKPIKGFVPNEVLGVLVKLLQ